MNEKDYFERLLWVILFDPLIYRYVAVDFIEQNDCEPSRYLFREQSHYESLWPVVGKILQPQFLVNDMHR